MAQGTLWWQPVQRMFAGGTNAVPNAKAYFFLAGTSTPTTVYADVALTIPLTQPVVADANGVFPEIFLTPGVAYKVDVQTSAGVSLPGYPADNQIAIPSSISPTFTGVAQDFRLSLVTQVSVPTTDVTAATLFFTPHIGRRCTVFDSTGVATTLLSPEISIAVPPTVSQMYDVFVFNNGGTLAAELLAWTNDTTRAVSVNKTIGGNDAWGIYTKSGDLTRRYVGSVRTTTVSGQAADTQTIRGVFNYYNRVVRPVRVFESTATWIYSLAGFRQANGNVANQIAVVQGIQEDAISLQLLHVPENDSGGNSTAAIGVNSTTTATGQIALATTKNTVSTLFVSLAVVPSIGYSVFTWLEGNQGTVGITTWFGVFAVVQTGLTGTWRN